MIILIYITWIASYVISHFTLLLVMSMIGLALDDEADKWRGRFILRQMQQGHQRAFVHHAVIRKREYLKAKEQLSKYFQKEKDKRDYPLFFWKEN